MGHRRNRKRDRRQSLRDGDAGAFFASPLAAIAPADDYPATLFAVGAEELPVAAPMKTCGGCVEFVEDQLTGRGECLHPGSGILRPWPDTAACQFHTSRRRSY